MNETFGLTDSLPTGRMLLEASAGTGKTYSIAALVTRYVAEAGVPISRILVVTFTKAAAAELRDRIRARIDGAAEALRTTLTGGVVDPGDDQVLALILEGPDADREIRFRRLEEALAEFDLATIGTIHSFAQTLLGEQGVASSTNPDAVLQEDTSNLLSEAVADVLALRGVSGHLSVKHGIVTKAADLYLRKPNAALRPTQEEHAGFPAKNTKKDRAVLEAVEIVAETNAVVVKVAERVGATRRNRAVLGFDDILVAASDLVTDPVSGPAAVAAVRSRIDLALIDEFQDTDGTQWTMLDALFGRTGAVLITVGDPKQSIYRFRGADIKAYLASSDAVGDSRFSLGTNFRSDPLLLDGAEALFLQAHFGDERIRFEKVASGKSDKSPFLLAGQPASGVEIRTFSDTKMASPVGVEATGADVARLVVDYLENGELPVEGGTRKVRPGDIAVLVRSHAAARPIQRHFDQAGVPFVIGNVGSVMTTEAASQLFTLLVAVAQPASIRLVRAAALGWFCEHTWVQLDAIEADQAEAAVVAELQSTFANWAEILQKNGLSAFFDRIWQHGDVAVRLLRDGKGERALTDLNHIRELLEAEGGNAQVHRLVERLEQLMADAGDDTDTELFARRTDSDDNAVQMMTVHASKGLEFPIAIAVGLHTGVTLNRPFSLDDEDGIRTVVVAGSTEWPCKVLEDQVKAEEKAEVLRLIYVAVTRAAHKSVVYLGAASRGSGPLSELLFSGPAPATGTAVVDALTERVRSSAGAFAVSIIDQDRPARRWVVPQAEETPVLDAATLQRAFDRDAQRWSFTRISGRRVQPDDHIEVGASVALQEDGPEQGVTDEATPDGLTVDDSDEQGSVLPLGNIAGGAAFGTLVHGVLEEIDFAAGDLEAELAEHVGNAVAWSDWNIDPAELSGGLVAAIETPLGPLLDNRSMRSFAPAEVLDEMTFELPLAPGVPIDQRPDGAGIGALILHHLAPDDLLLPWATGLANNAIRVDLAGHLTGAIDGIFRVRSESRPDRYVVVDYKTNRLGTYGSPLLLEDYSESGMAAAMTHHDYPLQALLYAVALHRYLRWRLGDGYNPEQNLGGAAYLFVRGMIGPETPISGSAPHGVFSWDIPPALIVALSDLLHGGKASDLTGGRV